MFGEKEFPSIFLSSYLTKFPFHVYRYHQCAPWEYLMNILEKITESFNFTTKTFFWNRGFWECYYLCHSYSNGEIRNPKRALDNMNTPSRLYYRYL